MKRLISGLAVIALLCGTPLASADVVHLEAEDYKAGGEGVGFHDDDEGNNGGEYRTNPGDDVDIQIATEDGVEVGFDVGWTVAGEWFKMTTDPGTWQTDPTFEGGDYYVKYRVASDPGGAAWHLEIDSGAAVADGAIGSTGGWQVWTTTAAGYGNPWAQGGGEATPVSIPAGSHEVKFVYDAPDANLSWVEFTTDVNDLPPPPEKTPQREITILNSPLPEGGAGYWGVREVINHSDESGAPIGIVNINDAVAAISWDTNSTSGENRVDYQASMVDIFDSGPLTGNFDNDDPFGVVTEGKIAAGQVDEMSVVAQGTIRIPETGMYTFGVNSNDGFELSIDGDMIIEFPNDRAAADTIGTGFLAQGNHSIRLVYYEGEHSSTVEVFAAEGEKAAFDDDFRLIGHQATGLGDFDGLQLVDGGVLLGDVNLDGVVNGLDVDPFVDVLLSGPYQSEADMNEDQVVNGLDVDPFVAAVVGGSQSVPEPSTLLLALVTLGVIGGWRKWGG
jgi:hypothetical protein